MPQRAGKTLPLQWRHNESNIVLNHQLNDCLLNRLFRRRSKKTPKLRITGLCAGKSPVTGEFPAQMASNAENVFIWWRDHDWVGDNECVCIRCSLFSPLLFFATFEVSYQFTDFYSHDWENVLHVMCILNWKTGLAIVESSPPGQNGRHFADELFRGVNDKFCILIKISLKFLPKGPINNKRALI